MNVNLEKELYETAAASFESLAFLFLMPELEEKQRDAEFEAAATVDFTGPFKGRLVLTLSGNLMSSLALNMLGTDDLPSRAEQRDALGEMANVVCGNALPRIAGVKKVFTIGAPEVSDKPEPRRGSGLLMAEVSLPLDEGRADIEFYVEN